jgi:SpoVK/Ycf46/Vps4 family AAA+-type ATPase
MPHDLETIMRSRFPIVTIETHEEERVVDLLRKLSLLNDWPLFTWDIVSGLVRGDRYNERESGTTDPDALLRHLMDTPQNGIYALLDIGPHLDDPIRLRTIKRIAQEQSKTSRTLVLVGHSVELPPDIRRHAASFELSVPTTGDLRTMMREELTAYTEDTGERSRGSTEAAELIIQHLIGLCAEDARRLLRRAIREDGALTMNDVSQIHKAKYELLGDDGVLSLELDTGKFTDIGGLNALKRWLELRRNAFAGTSKATHLEPPRGVLLLGVQGCGKSLAAKCVAGTWQVPLVRLDFGALYDKYFGETEKNLRKALATADSMSPCVLWIDEIEKGLSSAANSMDGGVSRRVFGSLLTWMAERNSRVFLVATANDIAAMPPELMRKGRFDEIFFVDLPDHETRKLILGIHLARRRLDEKTFDLDAVARLTDGFSGAELEQAIVASLYEAHNEGRPLDTEHLLAEATTTRPLSVVMSEKLGELRQWAAERAVMAH